MHLERLRIFVTLVQSQGVVAAAERLHMTQPAVTKHIRRLESELKTRLFVREGRRLVLTQAGEVFYGYATEALASADDVLRALGDLNSLRAGRVTVSTSLSIGTHIVAPLLTQFAQEHPGVTIIVQMADTRAVVRAVLDGTADLGCVVGDLDVPHLKKMPLWTEALIFVARPDHPLLNLPRVTAADLARYPFVSPVEGSHMKEFIDQKLAEAGIDAYEALIYLGTNEAIMGAVRRTLGLALLFRMVPQEAMRRGYLCEVPVKGVHLKGDFVLLYRERRGLSKLVEAVVAYLRGGLTNRF